MDGFYEYMEKRRGEVNKGYHDPSPPYMVVKNRPMFRQAATLAARSDRSDPFVYNRALLRLERGFYTPQEMLKGGLAI